MKNTADLNLPEDLRYTKEHVWVKEDNGELVAGISDFAQDQLGEVVYVDLPEAGKRLDAGAEFGSVESVKSVNSLYMPVSGVICAVNEELGDTPSLVNAGCYKDGWIIRIKPDNAQDAQKLLDAASYRKTLAGGE